VTLDLDVNLKPVFYYCLCSLLKSQCELAYSLYEKILVLFYDLI